MNNERITQNITYPEISSELIRMMDEDQVMRKSGVWDESVDAKNTERLKEIIKEIGWPTISKVGDRSSSAAWLIAQHADHDVTFQQQALDLMREESRDQIRPDHLAYLEDRVRVNMGQPQLYGTQFYTDESGLFSPRPIEDEEGLDKRREEVGLDLFAEYKQHMNRHNEEWKKKREELNSSM